MTNQSNAVPDSPRDPQAVPPAAMSETRPMYWLIRREIWENHSIYIAPLAVAAVYLLGFAISVIWLPHNVREVWMPHTMREMAALKVTDSLIGLAMPYTHAAMLIGLIAFLVGIFYSLDALHGERRDRSILFWKSLPVSDRTTVLSKASIPLVILPLLVFAVAVILHLVMLFLSIALLLLRGGTATLWAHLPLFQMELVLLYGLLVIALWHAPLYAWLLLVSAWARRATFLWAVLPLLAIAVFERIAFHTSHVGDLLLDRLIGFAADAFSFTTPDGAPVDLHFIPVSVLTPGKFLSTPGM